MGQFWIMSTNFFIIKKIKLFVPCLLSINYVVVECICENKKHGLHVDGPIDIYDMIHFFHGYGGQRKLN
jgi:hypothetical protein